MFRYSIFVCLGLCGISSAADIDERTFPGPIDVNVPSIKSDPTIKYDYDIVYVRAHRAGNDTHKRFFTDFSQPITLEPGADLMLLHPDGTEEVLVEGGNGSVTDPVMSFDGEWVFFSHVYDLRGRNQWDPPQAGADIFKLHLKTRKLVKLTTQQFTPNTGAAKWSSDFRKHEEGKTHYNYGVFNMGPYPLPGGRVVFTSNRDGYRPAKGYPSVALQLFVMDDDGRNVEKIGHLNISGALHPVVLRDGRIMFSSLESQGIRSEISWGIWTINPDGTNWEPLISAFDPGGASNGFHFQTQLSNGSIVIEEYYNQNNSGFGAYIKLPEQPPTGYAAFGPAYMRDARNEPWRFGRHDNGKGKFYRMPFMPTGSVSLTPFALNGEGPADHAILQDKKSPGVGKVTHPSGAPDNHLLTCYSPGPVNHQYKHPPELDGGIYLLKHGDIVEQPAQLRLIKNDPNYNECWPRAVVPYRRVFGIDEPKQIAPLANDGTRSKELPPGTPFALIGTSSFYKRESYPNGVVKEGSVTSTYAGGNDPWRGLDAFTSHGNGMPLNWHNQGGDAGLYENSQIHAVRILAMEPTTDRQRGANSGRRFHSHAKERLRILGEIPLRKFVGAGSGTNRTTGTNESGQSPMSQSPSSQQSQSSHRNAQSLDPDGNPDTSVLAKIPADTAFTFQTLDRDGMVLNMSQTWHQLRPGEVRHNCGGCHAHSQKPTEFSATLAAKPDYKVWDLVNSTPLITDKARDESKQRWDEADSTGLRDARRRGVAPQLPAESQSDSATKPPLTTSSIFNVEYHRDIAPILKRSCVACHSATDGKEPAAKLNLDADEEQLQIEHIGKFPGTFTRLALDERAKFGHRPVRYPSWGYPNASRYIRMFQSRRSLLVWKIFGQRLDGFSNDDHPSETSPGSGEVAHRGKPLDAQKVGHAIDIDYVGSVMPPADAVKSGKVTALSDEDRRTLVRWIDLGCPIDLDFDPAHPEQRGYGWMLDDNRPIVALTSPAVGKNAPLTRLLLGLHDYDSGLDESSLVVKASFPVNGRPANENLAPLFRATAQGVRELKLDRPLTSDREETLTVLIKDRQGNESRIDRVFTCRP